MAITCSAFNEWMTKFQFSAVDRLCKNAAEHCAFSFAGALPAKELFPADAIEDAFHHAIRGNSEEALQYNWCEGYEPLRDQIARRMCSQGMPTQAKNILVTHGAQQALDLISRRMLSPGDWLALESPTYASAIQVFALQQPRMACIPRNGVSFASEVFRELVETRPLKLLYLIPTGHNPTGESLDRRERREMLDVLREGRVPAIEDDAYGELQYGENGEKERPLRALADEPERVVYVGSFSKILSPGLRIGWIAADEQLIIELSKIKQATDLQTGSLDQLVLSKYLEEYSLDDHVKRSVDFYRKRRDSMLSAIRRYFPKAAKWSRPAAGFSIWVELRAEIDSERLLASAVRQEVAFDPGCAMFPEKTRHHYIRLSFSQQNPEYIEEGIRRLGLVLTEAFQAADLEVEA